MAKKATPAFPGQISAGRWTYYDEAVHGPQQSEGAENRSDAAPVAASAKPQDVPPGVEGKVDTGTPPVVPSQ